MHHFISGKYMCIFVCLWSSVKNFEHFDYKGAERNEEHTMLAFSLVQDVAASQESLSLLYRCSSLKFKLNSWSRHEWPCQPRTWGHVPISTKMANPACEYFFLPLTAFVVADLNSINIQKNSNKLTKIASISLNKLPELSSFCIIARPNRGATVYP